MSFSEIIFTDIVMGVALNANLRNDQDAIGFVNGFSAIFTVIKTTFGSSGSYRFAFTCNVKYSGSLNGFNEKVKKIANDNNFLKYRLQLDVPKTNIGGYYKARGVYCKHMIFISGVDKMDELREYLTNTFTKHKIIRTMLEGNNLIKCTDYDCGGSIGKEKIEQIGMLFPNCIIRSSTRCGSNVSYCNIGDLVKK